MLKRLIPFFVATIIAVFTAQPVHAQTLTIDSIGNASTNGQTFTSWTYIGANPVLKGTASPSALVNVKIENITYATNATTEGEWQYQPTTMSAVGAYSVQVSSLTETILFTLNIATASSASATPSPVATQPAMPDTLPESGSSTLFYVVGIGLFSIAIGVAARMTLAHNSNEA